MFKYTTLTKISVDGKPIFIKMEDGMTGIGSRKGWIGERQFNNFLIATDDIEVGDNVIYYAKWRDTPWDRNYFIINKNDEEEFLKQDWREPKKVNL